MTPRDDSAHLAARAALRERCPKPGTFWRHRKGGLYLVADGAVIEATLTPVVIYMHRSAVDELLIRPLEEFLERFEPYTGDSV